MRTYADHLTDRHRIEQLRPDLDAPAGSRVRPDAAAEPVGDLLPLPTATPSASIGYRYEVTSIDARGRLSLAAACRALGWAPGETKLTLARDGDFVSVQAADDAQATQLLSKHRLQLPRWAMDLVGLRADSQALLVVDPAGEVRIYPTTVLAAALASWHDTTHTQEVPA